MQSELVRDCPRPFCKGRFEYGEEEGHLQGTCIACGRPAFKLKLDRTPPDVAEYIEISLVRERTEW
jgi:hypothetical protein